MNTYQFSFIPSISSSLSLSLSANHALGFNLSYRMVTILSKWIMLINQLLCLFFIFTKIKVLTVMPDCYAGVKNRTCVHVRKVAPRGAHVCDGFVFLYRSLSQRPASDRQEKSQHSFAAGMLPLVHKLV